MNYLGPFAFIGARFLLGALSLPPVIWYCSAASGSLNNSRRGYLLASGVLGTILFVASSFQQVGLLYTTASNRLYYRYVHDLRHLRLMLYVTGDHLGWLCDRGSGSASSRGR